MSKKSEIEKNEAIEALRSLLPADTRVYASVLHVSASGISRTIALYIVHEGAIHDISWRAAKILGWRRDDKRGGMKVAGCGMNMCFHAVYCLSRSLFPEHGRSGYVLRSEAL
jgi:hypothetical protein